MDMHDKFTEGDTDLGLADNLSGDLSPIRLLSLDGGGIRGLSSLIILRHLMKAVNPENPPKPCDYFQLIGGTSTGGLIAIMLGRFRMDVDECISKYTDLSSEVFKLKRSRANPLGRAKDLWKAGGRFSSENMVKEFKEVAGQREGDEDALLRTPDEACRVFVCAQAKAFHASARLRSYVTSTSVEYLCTENCKIWEAARATSAASGFFDPISIGEQTFIDGATGHNNPVEEVWNEAKSIWPDLADRVECVVSIGTGKAGLKSFGDDLGQVIKSLISIATETEITEKRFYNSHVDFGLEHRYFRFNVDRGLETVRLDESEKQGLIQAATESYLQEPRVQKDIVRFLDSRSFHNDFARITSLEKVRYIGWLPYCDPGRSHNAAVSQRINDDTGSWFLNDEFLVWTERSSSFLWLCGKAGSGKTILTSSVAEKLRSEKLGAHDTLASFYFSFKRSDDIDAYRMLCSIVTSVLKASIRPSIMPERFEVPRTFTRLFDSYQPSTQPRYSDLMAVLEDLLQRTDRTYILVDGLDEASQPTQMKVLELLADINKLRVGSVHILLSSRDESQIHRKIDNLHIEQRTVRLDESRVDDDIKAHLRSVVGQGSYMEWSDDLKSEVVGHLTKYANGVFRWASLHIQALAQQDRENKVRKALTQLPKGLEATYQRMLERIEDSDNVSEAIVILNWLAYSRRPMTLCEIAELAAFEIEDLEVPPEEETFAVQFVPQNRFIEPASVFRLISGLVVVEDSSSRPNAVVSFAHSSVQEYLQGNRVSPSIFRLREKSCHAMILKCSDAYMSCFDTTISDSRRFCPVLTYACSQWWWHAAQLELREFEPSNAEGKTQRLAIQIAEVERRHAENTAAAVPQDKFMNFTPESEWWPSDSAFESHPNDANDMYTLHIAAAIGQYNVVQLLLCTGPGRTGSFRQGHRSGQTPLHAAAAKRFEYDHEKIVCASDFSPGISDHTKVVQCLLEADSGYRASVEKNGWTALHFAAAWGNPDVVDILLEFNDEDINHSDKLGQSSLSMASEAGQSEVVKRLLANEGVDADKQNATGRTPLSLAAAMGHEDVVKLLLERSDVNCNSTDDLKRTPLAWAASFGRDSIVRLLLSQDDIDVHKQDVLEMDALALALIHGHPTVVNQLYSKDKVDNLLAADLGFSLVTHATKRRYREILHLLDSSHELPPCKTPDSCASELSEDQEKNSSLFDAGTLDQRSQDPSLYTSLDNLSLSSDGGGVFVKQIAELNHGPEAWTVTWSHDGRRLAATGRFTSILIWDTFSLQPLFRLENHSDHIVSVSWSPDDSKLISCGLDQRVMLWDADNGYLIKSIHAPGMDYFSACEWVPDQEYVVLSSLAKQSLWFWNLSTNEVRPWTPKHVRAQTCAMSLDGKYIAFCDDNSTVYIYTADTLPLLERSFAHRPTSLSFMQDSVHLLIGFKNGEIVLIDIFSSHVVERFIGCGKTECLIRSGFHGEWDEFVISGSENGLVHMWRTQDGARVVSWDAKHIRCNSVMSHPVRNDIVASCGDDGTVKIWRISKTSGAAADFKWGWEDEAGPIQRSVFRSLDWREQSLAAIVNPRELRLDLTGFLLRVT